MVYISNWNLGYQFFDLRKILVSMLNSEDADQTAQKTSQIRIRTYSKTCVKRPLKNRQNK